MIVWYPQAVKKVFPDAGSFVSGYSFKGILHTTEGSTATGAFSAYKKNNSAPHFTVHTDGVIYQHLPIDKAARSLVNNPGGVETNRGGAIQLEVVGFASKPNWPPAQVIAMRALMRWIEAQTGIKPQGPGRLFATAYGQNYLRFTNNEWKTFNGWAGHCHVGDGNLHWDPGPIDITTLLPTPSNGDIIVSINAEPIAVLTHESWGDGYIIVAADGGVFGFGGAPFFGSLGGVALSHPIVTAVVTPTGLGYHLMGRDGGVFSFGDAKYSGRVDYTV